MVRKQTETMSHGIIGLGRFESVLAATLVEADREFMMLDKSEEKVRRARNYVEHTYVVKDLRKGTLRETGIQNCDVVVVCIGDKVDVSVLAILNITSLGVPQVAARADSPKQGEIPKKTGAQMVYPGRDMAIRPTRKFISKRIFSLFELDQNVDISGIKATRKFTGQSIRDVRLRNRYGIDIIAITRGRWSTIDTSPDYVFQGEDTVIVIGEREKIRRLVDGLVW